MCKVRITYVFGTREEQDLSDYPSGPAEPFVFTIMAPKAEKPSSWHSAYVLLACYRDDFIAACARANVSSREYALIARIRWIPTCYLECPTIKVDGEEFLLEGEKPNSWLS